MPYLMYMCNLGVELTELKSSVVAMKSRKGVVERC